MPEGPLGLPRFTDFGPLVDTKPNRYLVDNNLYIDTKFEMDTADEKSSYDHESLEGPPQSSGTKMQFQYTVLGDDTPLDIPGTVATTLMCSAEQDSSDDWPTAFHRLVMVDQPETREAMESLASEQVRTDKGPLGDTGAGKLAYGPSHMANPGDYIAAHWDIGEFRSREEYIETVQAIVKVFDESVRIAESSDQYGGHMLDEEDI